MSNIAKIRKIRDKIEAEVFKAEDRPELLDSTNVLKEKIKAYARAKKEVQKADAMLLDAIKKTIVISYLNGKQARVKMDEGYYIFVPNDMHYDVVCPCCGVEMELNLKEMLKADEIIEGMLGNSEGE